MEILWLIPLAVVVFSAIQDILLSSGWERLGYIIFYTLLLLFWKWLFKKAAKNKN